MRGAIHLRPLEVGDEDAALAAHAELAADGFEFLLGGWVEGRDWGGYVAAWDAFSRGEDLPEGWVPATFLVAVHAGELVGRTSIRHELNEFLEAWGGHIGYGVRPAWRRRGVATEILRLSLAEAAHLVDGDRVLLTCDDDNEGSIAVIEGAGGVLEDRREDPDGGITRRYRIALPARAPH